MSQGIIDFLFGVGFITLLIIGFPFVINVISMALAILFGVIIWLWVKVKCVLKLR